LELIPWLPPAHTRLVKPGQSSKFVLSGSTEAAPWDTHRN
jgi:hypothetical protein